ncbi:MAG TPA: YceI family protein [Chitinophagaceae bacterium]|jgi:polyisoprenoid-binding protein YceI
MKKITLFMIALSVSAISFAQTWTSDKPHSRLGFAVTHLGINEIDGAFKSFTATVTASKDDFSDGVIDLSADISSISTDVDQRDTHLKSADFFDATTFPTLTFKSTSFKKVGANKYEATGNLTLHGVTKPVTLEATLVGSTLNPMNKKPTVGFHVTSTIKRTDFGIGTKFPTAMLSDDVLLVANIELVKG